MTSGGWLVLAVVVFVAFIGAVIYVFIEASDWALRRQADRDAKAAERTAAASFECDFIPDSSEVSDHVTDELLNIVRERAVEAAATRVIYEAEMVGMLDEAQAHLDGLRP